MWKAKVTIHGRGPAIWAFDPWAHSAGRMRQLLSNEERARLAVISSIVRFKKGDEIYHQGRRANAVFIIISGVVKAYQTTSDGSKHVTAFLFPDDLFGLSVEGWYTNSTMAVTPVIAYQLPMPALRSRLSRDAGLEFHVIRKLCHELRQTQRHAFLLARRHALSKMALFLQLLEQLQGGARRTYDRDLSPDEPVPHRRVCRNVARSRAFRGLTATGIIKFRDRSHLKILDRDAFEKIAGETN